MGEAVRYLVRLELSRMLEWWQQDFCKSKNLCAHDFLLHLRTGLWWYHSLQSQLKNCYGWRKDCLFVGFIGGVLMGDYVETVQF